MRWFLANKSTKIVANKSTNLADNLEVKMVVNYVVDSVVKFAQVLNMIEFSSDMLFINILSIPHRPFDLFKHGLFSWILRQHVWDIEVIINIQQHAKFIQKLIHT